jgi:DNA-binding beta-propeller fold protein YncE
MSLLSRRVNALRLLRLGCGNGGALARARSGASSAGLVDGWGAPLGGMTLASLAAGEVPFHRLGRPARALLLVVLSCAGLLAVSAAPASAAIQHPYLSQLTGFSSAHSVAVDDFSGQTLVADSGPDVVDVFDSSGNQVATWNGSSSSNAPGTPSGSFGGGQVTVAANNSTGDVYVTDSSDGVVDILSSTGAYLGQLTGVTFSSPQAIAVDQATGAIYVADPGAGVVDVFDSSGTFTGTLTGQSFGHPNSVAVDDQTGQVLVGDSGPDVVDVFDAATGAYQATWNGSASSNPPGTPAGSFGGGQVAVAADNATGHVFVADSSDSVVDELDGSGNYLAQIAGTPNGAFSYPQGVAVGQASGDLYVADTGNGTVDIFGPGELVPDVSTGSPSDITATGATLNGTVNADGTTITGSGCRFAYVDADRFNPQASDPYSAGGSVTCSPTPTGSSPVSVSAAITGLTAGTLYHYRLVATNSNGTSTGADQTLFIPGTPGGPVPTAGKPGLPDGRVYEQVSPEDKNGSTAGGVLTLSGAAPDFAVAAADGNSVFSADLVYVNQNYGADSSSLQPFSVFTRSSAGWSARGVLPPQNQAPNVVAAQFSDFLPSADFSSLALGSDPSLGSAPQNAADLIGADGSLTWMSDPLGPSRPPVITGAAQDLSRVFFWVDGSGFYEWTPTGGMTNAGVLPDGSTDANAYPAALWQGNGGNYYPLNFNNHEVSADGSRAFFVGGEPSGSGEEPLYVRETASDGSQKTILIADGVLAVPSVGTGGNGDLGCYWPAQTGDCVSPSAYASPDGSQAFFEDASALTSDAPDDGSVKEYEFDTQTNTLSYLPGVADQLPNACGGFCYSPILTSTSDGSSFLFVKETPGGWSLDVSSAGTITSVAQFPEGPNPNGGGEQYTLEEARTSTDGSAFVFQTDSPIYTTAPGQFNNTGGFQEIYRYDVGSGRLSCLSCGPAGARQTGDAAMSSDANRQTVSGQAVADNHAISSDGDRVFFDSPDALVPQAANGHRNVYEWEAAGLGTCPASTSGGCLFLISSGQSSQPDFFLDTSASGNDVFFATTDGLVPQDVDGSYDIYDARVGGGFPTPVIVPCSGDACQGPPSALPTPPTAATVTFYGPGNQSSDGRARRVRVLTHTVHGDIFRIRVKVPGPGRIAISGAGVRNVRGAVRHVGTFAVRVTLTAEARRRLGRRGELKLRLRVLYRRSGGETSAANVRVTVRPRLSHRSRQARQATYTTGRSGR